MYQVEIPSYVRDHVRALPVEVRKEIVRLLRELREDPLEDRVTRVSLRTPKAVVFNILGNGAYVSYLIEDGNRVLVRRADIYRLPPPHSIM